MQEGYSGCLGRGLHDFDQAQQHYEQRTLGAGIGESVPEVTAEYRAKRKARDAAAIDLADVFFKNGDELPEDLLVAGVSVAAIAGHARGLGYDKTK